MSDIRRARGWFAASIGAALLLAGCGTATATPFAPLPTPVMPTPVSTKEPTLAELLGSVTPPANPTIDDPLPTADSRVVKAGTYCTPAGATGRTSSGAAMTCKRSATDSRNRWRAS